jgi:pimeloyl-ACP methyl ester carboxylesterase
MNALRIAALSAAVAVGIAGCGSDDDPAASPSPTTSASTTTTIVDVERPTSTVERDVVTSNGALHLRCTGQGATTVLVIPGWGDDGTSWRIVESAVAERARVCTYSPFGTGASDAPPSTQTFRTHASDLHDLLDEAGEPGPYVVAGHSFGGAEAVTFTSQYSDEVAGLVLVDASPVTWPAAVCGVPTFGPLCGVFRDPAQDPERIDVFAAFEEAGTIRSLGELPTTVITAAVHTWPGLTADELARLNAIWADGAERWAALSTSSTIVTVEGTGHVIQLDQPEVVSGEIVGLL